MIAKEILKEVIISNENFILNRITKIIPRERIIFPETVNKVVALYGIRRSGKTFVLFEVFRENSECALYTDFEDERLSGFELKDFQKLKDVFFEIKHQCIEKTPVFLLDEIQNVKGWEKFCRRAVERENIKVYVSGSSSHVMPYEIHTELRGRSWSIELQPFSFREYLYSKEIDADARKNLYGTAKAHVKKHFSEYLKWGGFPEVVMAASELEKIKLLREYFSAMFFRDLVEKYGMTNIPLVESLSDKLFSSFSTKFSAMSFYKQYKDKFPFSKDLLFRYYKHLIGSMLVFESRKFSESTYKRMRNPAKIYLADTGLARRITSADAGRLLENAVFVELRRRGYEVFYFEEKRECDFIAKTGDNTFQAFQVCYELSKENREREIEGLITACKWIGVKKGMLLTYDDEEDLRSKGINIKVLPVWKWALQKV